jgi:hypothetical protein
MNTQREIEQANADLAAGKFDHVTLEPTSLKDSKTMEQTALEHPGPTDNSQKSILARGCDPSASMHASRAIPTLIGNPEYVPTTTDDEFIEQLTSRSWSVVFFAPGACRFSAAGQSIPGGNTDTRGWTLDQYRDLVRTHQGDQVQIVEAPQEKETVTLLADALSKAPNTT